MRAHLFQLCRHSAASALILAAGLSATPALAQTMGGLQSTRPLPPPQLAPSTSPATGAVNAGTSGAAVGGVTGPSRETGLPSPAPAGPASNPTRAPEIRDLDAAAPQNIRPPCNCPPPRHPTLEPTAVVMFRAAPPPPVPLTVPPPAPSIGTTGSAQLVPVTPLAPLGQDQALQPQPGMPPPPVYHPLPPSPLAALEPGAPLVSDPTIGPIGPPREPRGPFTRIWQDSRRLVVQDAPEALANVLPWVDRDLKDEPLDVVLNRVAGQLSRADAADPEWALGAERELRALDARLQRLPEPPPAQPVLAPPPEVLPAGPDARPFQPRPVWPGATVTSEPQRRPSALGSGTEQLDGPTATGRGGSWAPPADLAPPAPPPPPPPPPTRTRRGRS